ncbi:UTP--glucose-1-phosphate uridylyltransferase GalU [Bacillaceae bacterium]
MIKKAIIPAAGLGTRFLPATKAQPKEMLPIVDKPTIQYIIEEAVASGIEDIIIVTGRNKRAIEDHFDKSVELEMTLREKGKLRMLEVVEKISQLADIHYIRQKEPRGLGHAIYCARKFIGNEPFAVLLGDDIVQNETPCLRQLIDVYERFGQTVVGVQEVPWEETRKYGIIDGEEVEERLYRARRLVEKPEKDPPSRIAVMGRYILEPDVFARIAGLSPGTGGEIQLTDALDALAREGRVLAYAFDGQRYDVGDKLGYLKATVEIALQREDIRSELIEYLERTLEKHRQNSLSPQRSKL